MTADYDEKTRVTQVVQQPPADDSPSNDCLVVIYTAEPGLLGKRFVLDKSPTRVGRGADSQIVLEGDSVSPSLIGPSFLGRFNGQTAHEMVQAVRASMPQNAPDTLGDRGYVDLIAFLLAANGAPTGASELPLDVAELEKIVVTAEQP